MSYEITPAVRRAPATAPLQRTTSAAPTAPLADPLGMSSDWLSMSKTGAPIASQPSTSDLMAKVKAAQESQAPTTTKEQTLSDLNRMLTGIRGQRQSLTKLLDKAGPAEQAQIRAQLAQLNELTSGLTHMRRRLYHFQPPANLSQNEQAVVARSISQIGDVAKGLASGSMSVREARVNAAQYLQQMATPGLDLGKDPVARAHQDTMINLVNVQGKVQDKMDELSRQFQDADAVTKAVIHNQLNQLGRFHEQTEKMLRGLEQYRRPATLSPQEQQTAASALGRIDDLTKQLAGASGSQAQEILVNFSREMNQLRNPGLDARQDTLFVNQHNALLNSTTVQGRLMDRMDQLNRQLDGADAATAQQLHAQIAQLGRTYDRMNPISSQLSAYQAPADSSAEARQAKAALIDQIDGKVKQMAGADAETAQKILLEANQLFRELRS